MRFEPLAKYAHQEIGVPRSDGGHGIPCPYEFNGDFKGWRSEDHRYEFNCNFKISGH